VGIVTWTADPVVPEVVCTCALTMNPRKIKTEFSNTFLENLLDMILRRGVDDRRPEKLPDVDLLLPSTSVC
jgi:hypothetical protein